MSILDERAYLRFQGQASENFACADFVYMEAARRLVDRLGVMQCSHESCLQIGPMHTSIQSLLSEHYPGIGYSQVEDEKELCALDSNSQDIIIACLNLSVLELEETLVEARRVLKEGGVFLLALLGPNTLSELQQSFSQDSYPHVYQFYDMHDVGDMLLHLGWSGPVMEMHNLSIHYKTLEKLFVDLRMMGCQNALENRRRGLTGKSLWANMQKKYKQYYKDECYPVSIELILGHAWKSGVKRNHHQESSETVVPVSDLVRMK